HSNETGETRARSVDVLRCGDDQRRIRFHVGNGTVGSERSMGVIWAAANLSHNVRSSGYCRIDISFFEDDPVLRLLRTHLRVQVRVAGEHGLNVPRHLQQFRCSHGIPFPFGYNANKIATPDDPGARNAPNRGIVNAQDLRASAVCALSAWPYDASMQHS